MKQSLLRRVAAWIAMAVVLFVSAQTSRAEVYDLGVMVPEQVYEFPEFVTVTGQYTPSETGPVRFLFSCSPITLYSSPGHEEESIVGGDFSYTSEGQLVSYPELEGGKTYYLYTNMSIMGGTLIIHEGATTIELLETTPPFDGGKISVSDNYRIYVDFNIPVTIGNVFLIAGDQRERISAMAIGSMVSCEVADQIMNFYRSGALKEGDTLTLRILQIKDASDENNRYGTTGKLEIDFIMAAKPAEVVETRGFKLGATDNVMDSFYMPGDDAGKMTLVFDRELSPVGATGSLAYGNTDNMELGIYTETIPGVINGNEASFDFTGRLRRPADMLPGSDPALQPSDIFASFGNMRSTDGQRTYTGMMSNPTGYSVSFRINTLQYNIAADFTPARGSRLSSGTNMEIWVMNGSKIAYEAIRMDYVENGQPKTIIIPASDVTAEADPLSEEDMLFTFVLPEFNADADTDIDLYMEGLTCADGLDHRNDVYGDFRSQTTGIDDIATDSEVKAYDVYDIAGQVVIRATRRADLSQLEKGLYIINGEKVIIK